MIARLAGTVLEKRGDAAVLDVQGVGYLVHLSLQSMAGLPPEGGRAQLRCYTHVREDALQLFGFLSPEEEELFHLLISVSGVGPKLGINILSGMPTAELREAIRRRVVPLIGPSSITLALMASGLEGQRFAFCGYLPREAAERTRRIRELEQRSRRERETQIFIETPYRNEALLSALVNLGYRPAAAERTVETVRRNLGATTPLEDQLREALRLIAGAP